MDHRVARLDTQVMAERFKPGQTAPHSGQVEIVGPRGGHVDGQERTVVRGETMPPTPSPGLRYEYVDYTRNGSGRS